MKDKKRVLLVSHATQSEGVAHKVLFYLQNRKDMEVVSIFHPLNPPEPQKSVLSTKTQSKSFKIFPLLQFFLEGLSQYYVLRKISAPTSYDLIICCDPLSFLHIYFLRPLLKSRRIIYYSVDYSKRRYSNPYMNKIYQAINKFAYIRSDYFFTIIEAFVKDIDPDHKLKNRSKVFTVRHIIDFSTKKSSLKKIPHSLLFAGTMFDSVYFDPLIEALGRLKKEQIDFRCDIYGYGDKVAYVKDICRKAGVSDRVHFRGVVPFKEFDRHILPRYQVGLSPYIPMRMSKKQKKDFIFNVEDLTTKMVDYISWGLPIVCSYTYPFLKKIEDEKFGFVVESSQDWYAALKSLLTDKKLYSHFHKNAFKFALMYDQKKVLDPIFDEIFHNDD